MRSLAQAPLEPVLAGRPMGFGEGNFQALYDSIELDQKQRGVL
jgi:4-hydroxyphenylpyruvate dioxygenase-like putative hemolysin